MFPLNNQDFLILSIVILFPSMVLLLQDKPLKIFSSPLQMTTAVLESRLSDSTSSISQSPFVDKKVLISSLETSWGRLFSLSLSSTQSKTGCIIRFGAGSIPLQGMELCRKQERILLIFNSCGNREFNTENKVFYINFFRK